MSKHLFPSVGAFGVRRVGGRIVVEFGTPQGEYIFHVQERTFVRHARGAKDDLGNRFRSLQEIDAEANVPPPPPRDPAPAPSGEPRPPALKPCGKLL